MIKPKTVYRQINRGDRLYKSMLKIIIAADTTVATAAMSFDPNFTSEYQRNFVFNPKDGSGDFEIAASDATWLMLQDKEPDALVFWSTSSQLGRAMDEGATSASAKLNGFFAFIIDIAAAVYVTFFEQHSQWLGRHFTTDIDKQPELFRFARTIRNAAAHQGRISWNNPNRAAVQWKNFEYSNASNGAHVIGEDLHIAELMQLMFCLSDELDRLGCPSSI